jgi:hypothetical protein
MNRSHVIPIASRHNDRVVHILTVDATALVLTQKLALPSGVPVALAIHYVALGYLLLIGAARVSTVRAALFCCLAGTALAVHLHLSSDAYSVPSIGLMLGTALMLVVVTPLDEAAYLAVLRMLVGLALMASVLVFVDWLAQAASLGMPSIETVIPKTMLYSDYVYVQPLTWHSAWNKPNGLFFLETSHVSQFIAMGAILELLFFRRPLTSVILVAALASTFGGTGIVLFLTGLPFVLLRTPPRAALLMLAAVPLAYLALNSSGVIDNFVHRTAEFSQNDSSAHNRFILPVQRFTELWSGDPAVAWLGQGAGSMPKAVNSAAHRVIGLAWPPYVKVAVEYGGIVLASWIAFVLVSMFGNGVPVAVSWVAFAQFQFLNGSLNVPIHSIYCWLLCAGYVIVRERPVPSASPRAAAAAPPRLDHPIISASSSR